MSNGIEFDPQIALSGSNFSVNRFVRFMNEGALILRPAFQRNLVWNTEQQSFLIDSILRGLPVPEIYIQTETSAAGDEELIVVDGQQRISACLRFVGGELRLSNSEELDPRWRGRKFAEIGEALQKRLRGFQLIVRELPELDDVVLREVFRRLNKTVEALEAQELRHAAYTGPFIVFVENLAAATVFGEIGSFSPRDYLRRKNDEFIAEVAFAVVSKAYPNKKEGLDAFFKTMDLQGMEPGDLRDLQRRFGRVLRQLDTISSGLRRSRFKNKSDFYTLLVCLAKQAERLPLNETASAKLMQTLKDFSELVNTIKREEAEGNSIDDLTEKSTGEAAVKYLRAVERAASDRLSRVRRESALQEVIGENLSMGEVVDLTEEDAQWAKSDFEDEDEVRDEQDKDVAEQVLLGEVGEIASSSMG